MPSAAARHLLVVATNFAETHGGVEVHLAELLPRLVARQTRVTLAYLGAERRRWDADGVEVLALRRRLDLKDVIGLPDPRDWRALVDRVRALPAEGRVTHVATHTRFFPMSLLGVRLGHRLGTPVVHTEHGAGSVVTGSALVRAGSAAIDRTMGRQVLRGADVVLAVSQATASFVQDLSGRAAVPFSNGIDLASWLPRSTTPDAAGGPRPLVYVGRVVEEKGWRAALDAAAHAQAVLGEPVSLHVVGEGPDLGRLRAQAECLRLERVTCHGRLAADEIRALLSGSVYLNPSVAAEGFQLTQLEAAAAGAAVVTYDVGVARELDSAKVGDVTVVPVGDVARLSVEAADALRRPPVPPDERALSRWDWGVLADRYTAVLDEAVPTSDGTRPGGR